MTLSRLMLTALLAVFAWTAPAHAAMTAKEKDEIGHVVREYLLANPEVLIEVMSALESKRQAEAQARQNAALKALGAKTSDMTPVAGNPDGALRVVEFFDYQCGYCKKVFPHLRQIMADGTDIRVEMKEFPILGPESEIAARAGLAVWKLAPKKYMEFHTKLMDVRGRLTENKIIVTATELGLKETDVRKAMLDPAVTAELQATAKLAETLNLTGTPAFIIGDQVFPGYMDLENLRAAVAQAQKK